MWCEVVGEVRGARGGGAREQRVCWFVSSTRGEEQRRAPQSKSTRAERQRERIFGWGIGLNIAGRRGRRGEACVKGEATDRFSLSLALGAQ